MKSQRIDKDNYPTPPEFAKAGVETAISLLNPLNAPYTVFEPGCGDTAPHIKHALSFDCVEECVGVDIRDINIDLEENFEMIGNFDFLKKTQAELIYDSGFGFQNLIITNPPYKQALDFIRHSLDILVDGGIAGFLLKLDFLGTKERRKFFKHTPPILVKAFGKRPSFIESKGTDYHNYCYIYFKKGFTGKTTFEWFDF